MMNASPAPQEIFLLKLGEVVLKGQNRQSFEDKLLANVRRRVKNCGSFQCSLRQSTIYVEPQGEDCDMEAAWDACRQVFGIAAVARAVPCEKTVDAIVEAARTYLADAFAVAKSFKVESKRADKMFPMNSIQLSQAVGGDLAELFPHVAVDVHTPDLTVFVEIREKYAYIHTPSVPGAGGLPIGMGGRAVSLLSGGLDSPVSSYMIARRGVELEMVHFVSPPYTSQQALDKVLELARLLTPIGMGGRAVSLLSGGIDSPVSSWMMARRGVELEMVHFVSPPYTSQQAQDKVLELARLLTAWTGRLLVHIVPFTEIQEEIRRNCPEEYFTLIMRRFMMRIAEAIARKANAGALVTGESLGQVASQTMLALGVTEDVTSLPVLRPLIGMDKVEIIRMSREIGVFDTSILPYEDCCTVFTPRHPATRPRLEDVRQAEAALDVESLVQKALADETWVQWRSTDPARILINLFPALPPVAGRAAVSKRRVFPCHTPRRSSPSAQRSCWVGTSPTPTPRCSLRACPPWASTSSGTR